MKQIRVVTATILLLLTLATHTVFAQDESILEVLTDHEELSIFFQLLESSNLVEPIAAEALLTLFVPNNAAFDSLSPMLMDYLSTHPDVLNKILSYHVVNSPVEILDEQRPVETLEGGGIEMHGNLVDGTSILERIEAGNGIIYVVDGILLPDIELPLVDPLDFMDGQIVAAGSSTVFPLTERMSELWEEEGGIAPSVDNIGTGAGFERFCIAGETDISNASRAIRPNEVESCQAIGRQPIEFRVGTDALAIVVSTANDFVDELSIEELTFIYSGAEFWSQVRPEWPDETILHFSPGTDSGTFDYFVEEIFDEDESQILAVPNLQLSEDDNVLADGVLSNPYAIGYFGFAYYQEYADGLRAIHINGVDPNALTAEDGTYPLARPLFIYSDLDTLRNKPEVAAFVNFYLSYVNDEVLSVGYFPASKRALNLARLNLLATGIYDSN